MNNNKNYNFFWVEMLEIILDYLTKDDQLYESIV
jgi:hypothetical protein